MKRITRRLEGKRVKITFSNPDDDWPNWRVLRVLPKLKCLIAAGESLKGWPYEDVPQLVFFNEIKNIRRR